MHYYKQIDETGNIISVLSCDVHLAESETQIEITEEEYTAFIESLPEPEEPEVAGYIITDEEIDAAYKEGVNEA